MADADADRRSAQEPGFNWPERLVLVQPVRVLVLSSSPTVRVIAHMFVLFLQESTGTGKVNNSRFVSFVRVQPAGWAGTLKSGMRRRWMLFTWSLNPFHR